MKALTSRTELEMVNDLQPVYPGGRAGFLRFRGSRTTLQLEVSCDAELIQGLLDWLAMHGARLFPGEPLAITELDLRLKVELPND